MNFDDLLNNLATTVYTPTTSATTMSSYAYSAPPKTVGKRGEGLAIMGTSIVSLILIGSAIGIGVWLYRKRFVCKPKCVHGKCKNKVCQCEDGWKGDTCAQKTTPCTGLDPVCKDKKSFSWGGTRARIIELPPVKEGKENGAQACQTACWKGEGQTWRFQKSGSQITREPCTLWSYNDKKKRCVGWPNPNVWRFNNSGKLTDNADALSGWPPSCSRDPNKPGYIRCKIEKDEEKE